jgi:hypothetical protein
MFNILMVKVWVQSQWRRIFKEYYVHQKKKRDWWFYPYVEAKWWFYPLFSNMVILSLFFTWSNRLPLVWMSLDAAGLNKLKREKENISRIRKDQSTSPLSNHSGQYLSHSVPCPWVVERRRRTNRIPTEIEGKSSWGDRNRGSGGRKAEAAKIGAAAAEIEAAAEIGAIFSVNSDHRTGCPYQCRCPHFLSRASVLDGGEASSPSEQNPGLWFTHGHAAKSLSRTEAMPDRILVASSGQRRQTSSKSRRWAQPPSRGPRGPHRAAGLLGPREEAERVVGAANLYGQNCHLISKWGQRTPKPEEGILHESRHVFGSLGTENVEIVFLKKEKWKTKT